MRADILVTSALRRLRSEVQCFIMRRYSFIFKGEFQTLAFKSNVIRKVNIPE